MSEFKQYRKKAIAEMRPYVVGEDMTGVSISIPDREKGSPKEGDMIAHDVNDHTDQWLVSKRFFQDNYTELEK